ncbi:hypothetical protein BD414DRAFT_481594 [Trametes punicea]|nr:hypothetical protein BD414DRAFT_481594 [Trametes punicea]
MSSRCMARKRRFVFFWSVFFPLRRTAIRQSCLDAIRASGLRRATPGTVPVPLFPDSVAASTLTSLSHI